MGLSREDRKFLDLASGGNFFSQCGTKARYLLDIMSRQTPCLNTHKLLPEKELISRQEKEVLIAKSQPLQSEDLAIDPKISIPQNPPTAEIPLLKNLSDTDG